MLSFLAFMSRPQGPLILPLCSYDEQKRNVEGYQDWRDNLSELKPWLETTKTKLDACKRPTSDRGVRKKQTEFLKVGIYRRNFDNRKILFGHALIL